MAEFDLGGLGVALITPFNDDNSIDYTALENLIDYVSNGGADYLVVLGTTAETPTLSREEKIEITDFVKQKNGGRIPLVLGIGGNNTKRVIENIERRNLDGYNAILSVVPFYNKPTQEGLFQHFKSISESSPLPVILYNVPSRTGVNLTAKTTLRLSETSDNILGIKEASGDLKQIEEIIKNARESFKVISGNDSDTVNIMKAGGKGVISVLANALPKEMKKLVSLCSNDRFEEAQLLQDTLKPLIGNLFEDGNPAGVKYVLSSMGRINNLLRLPLVPVSRHIEEKLNLSISQFL